MNYKHSELTSGIINTFYHVYNQLGYGFLEKVYENALAHEWAYKELGGGKITRHQFWVKLLKNHHKLKRMTQNNVVFNENYT